MECFFQHGDSSTPKHGVTVTNAKPAPVVEQKALSDYCTHNSELVQSFHGLRKKGFSFISFLVLVGGEEEVWAPIDKTKAKLSQDLGN